MWISKILIVLCVIIIVIHVLLINVNHYHSSMIDLLLYKTYNKEKEYSESRLLIIGGVMERWTNEDGVQALFEIFTASQRLILNSLDDQGVRFTRYQLYLLMVLARKGSLTMGRAAASIGCSKEQATRLVAALVEAGYVERLHSEENRKLVIIRLTEEGENVMHGEMAAAREKLKEDLSCLNKEERDVFFNTMKQFVAVLRKLEAHQERGRREAEHEIYRKNIGSTVAGRSSETKMVR